MLTDPQLIGLIQSGKLVDWTPPAFVIVCKTRYLLMTPEVADAVNRTPWDKAPGETPAEANIRKRQFQAFLARFVNGDQLVPNTHVKALQPTTPEFRDLIEFRSGPPDPQTRALAYVFSPGTWVATGFHLRDDLGNKGDSRWLAAATASKAAWASLFHKRTPHKVTYPCDTKAKLRTLLDV